MFLNVIVYTKIFQAWMFFNSSFRWHTESVRWKSVAITMQDTSCSTFEHSVSCTIDVFKRDGPLVGDVLYNIVEYQDMQIVLWSWAECLKDYLGGELTEVFTEMRHVTDKYVENKYLIIELVRFANAQGGLYF